MEDKNLNTPPTNDITIITDIDQSNDENSNNSTNNKEPEASDSSNNQDNLQDPEPKSHSYSKQAKNTLQYNKVYDSNYQFALILMQMSAAKGIKRFGQKQ